jgi:hypothetical protein
MISPLRTTLLLSCLWPLLGGVASAQPLSAASVPRVLIDSSLQQREFTLLSITDEHVIGIERGSQRRTLPLRDIIAILPPLTKAGEAMSDSLPWRDPTLNDTRPQGRLDLTDGQVYPGSLWPAGSTPDHVGWETRLWGSSSISLERVSSLRLIADSDPRRPDTRLTPGATQDTVWLRNGDRLVGFIDSIAESVSIETDRAAPAATIPIDRVAAITLASRPETPSGIRLWLYDGTVAASAVLRISGSGTTAELAEPQSRRVIALDPGLIRAIVFDAARVMPLAHLGQPRVQAGPRRRWAAPPIIGDIAAAPLGAARVELPGPMECEWPLPDAATRFAALCELPAASRVWGDCELLVELISGANAQPAELFRVRLHATNYVAELNVDLGKPAPGRTLRISLLEGPSGPIQDRAVLWRPLILLAPSEGGGPQR